MSKEIKVYLNDTQIIQRTRGWRSKLNNAIKNFPPASLECDGRTAVITIRYTLKAIIVTKKWE